MKEGQLGGFPIATTIQATLTYEIFAGITVGEVYLFVILVSVFVCTLAIQGAATRMMFSMSRDRHLPLGSIWGRVNSTFKTPANAAIAVGVLAAIPILVVGPLGGFTLSIAATGLIYLSYLLANLAVMRARMKGWPRCGRSWPRSIFPTGSRRGSPRWSSSPPASWSADTFTVSIRRSRTSPPSWSTCKSRDAMFRWYVINTYSGHENKVKANLEHRVKSMSQEQVVRRVVVPTESVVETKDGQKVQTERRLWPGYVLVNMDLTDDAWTLVKNTPGVTGFVGSQNKPVPLSQAEVDRMLHTAVAQAEQKTKAKAEFTMGDNVKITSGYLADFDGEIAEINEDQGKLKVLVSIFERQVPVELEFDKVKKI
jgi:transcriptional antiterminator NusG